MRYALYFTPAHGDRLTVAASSWLGRDAFTNEPLRPPLSTFLTPAEIAYHTAAARRYGFHATLKAPFELAEGETEAALLDALDTFARRAKPFVIPRVRIDQLDGFFAVVPDCQASDLDAFAAAVVRDFDRFRAPLSDAEIARRNPDALSPEQVRNLVQWGYPHVFESFQFHMTLTGRVPAAEARRVRAALDEIFQTLLEAPIAVEGLALFVEPEPGAPFAVLSYKEFVRERERKTA